MTYVADTLFLLRLFETEDSEYVDLYCLSFYMLSRFLTTIYSPAALCISHIFQYGLDKSKKLFCCFLLFFNCALNFKYYLKTALLFWHCHIQVNTDVMISFKDVDRPARNFQMLFMASVPYC